MANCLTGKTAAQSARSKIPGRSVIPERRRLARTCAQKQWRRRNFAYLARSSAATDPLLCQPGLSRRACQHRNGDHHRDHRVIRGAERLCGSTETVLIERTFGCIRRCRRLASDGETTAYLTHAFFILAAATVLVKWLARKL